MAEFEWYDWILLIIGGFYAFFPHTIHLNSGFDFGLSHPVHLMIGYGLLGYLAYSKWK